MKRLSLFSLRRLLLVALLGAVYVPTVCSGQGGKSPLTPPNSNAFGKSFAEWNVLQTQFAIELGLGGLDPNDQVKKVRLLPGSFETTTPVFEITMRPGTPFVAAPWFVFGERYDDPNVPDDDPVALADFLAFYFAGTQITTTLNGAVLLDGTAAELEAFQFGPTYLEDPVFYADPQPRGPDLNAVAALWVMGIGSVYHPLPVGEHLLVQQVDNDHPVFGFHFLYTYHITVSPR